MVKMKPERKDYEAMIAQAVVLMGGWMTFFPAPDCPEQQEVLDATRQWLDEVAVSLE